MNPLFYRLTDLRFHLYRWPAFNWLLCLWLLSSVGATAQTLPNCPGTPTANFVPAWELGTLPAPNRFYHKDGSFGNTFYKDEVIYSFGVTDNGGCKAPNSANFRTPNMPASFVQTCTAVNFAGYWSGVQGSNPDCIAISSKTCQKIGPTTYVHSRAQRFQATTTGDFTITFANSGTTTVTLTILDRFAVYTDCGNLAGNYNESGTQNGKKKFVDSDGNELYYDDTNARWVISGAMGIAYGVASTADIPPLTGWQHIGNGCIGNNLRITAGEYIEKKPEYEVTVVINSNCIPAFNGTYKATRYVDGRPVLIGPNNNELSFRQADAQWQIGNNRPFLVNSSISLDVPSTCWSVLSNDPIACTLNPNSSFAVTKSTRLPAPLIMCVTSLCGNYGGFYTQTGFFNERPDFLDEDQNRLFYWGMGDPNRPEGWYIADANNKYVYYNSSTAESAPTTGWQAFTGDGISCTDNIAVTNSATIAYSNASYCKHTTTQAAVNITGTASGTFSSTEGLSIDASTGAINPSVSTPGTYVVTYSIAGGCDATTSVTIDDYKTPSVAIAANPSGSITPGTSVTFTATPTNGGTSPTYVWKKNDAVIPNETGATFTTTTLADGDKIKVEMTSNDACASPTLATSSELTMEVNPCLNVTNRLYVTPTGTGNGSSWANATSDLQAAIDNTCGVTEIWVKAGTYLPTKDPFGNANPTDPRNKTFYLKDGVAIYGGFAGTETDRSQRNPSTNVTILSGDIGTPNDPADNCYHVAITINDGPNTVLDGFTITKGTTASSYSFEFVEGFRVSRRSGAGLHLLESAITLNNCIFEGNAGVYGGGLEIYMYEVAPVISRCRFTNNKGIGSDPVGSGMNLYADGNAEISFTDCEFSSNTGGVYGGAAYLYLDASTHKVNFIGCTFAGNAANNGGAMYTYTTGGSNQFNFIGCTFTGNTATLGGAIYQDEGTNSDAFTFTNSLLVGNQSTEKGGALYLNAGISTIINSTFYGNSTTSTTQNSGAIYAPQGLTIVNSILWGNTSAASGAQQQIDYGSSTPNVTYSIVQGTSVLAGTGNSNADPLFVNAADPNGADNIFATADDGLALKNCSPALNVGNNAVVTSSLDLVKASRIQYTTVDMGAYENANPSVSVSINSVTSICAGATINLIASGGNSYSWVHSGGGSFSSSTNPVTFSSSSAGGFSFTVTATITGGCTATTTTSLSVKASPSVIITPSATSVCAGKSINLNASPPSQSSAGLAPATFLPSDGYAWASSGGTFVSSTGSPVSWSSGSSGTFSFTVTATNTNSCSASATATVRVNDNPTVSISPPTSNLCVGATLELRASPNADQAGLSPSITPVSSDSYAWASSGGTFNSSAATATFSSSSAGGFSFTVTATNSNSCSATATASVTVGGASITAMPPTSICAGATINLTADGGISYSWVHSGGGSFSSSTNPVTFSSSSAGGFSFTVTATVSGGCTATATTSLSVKAKPTVSINSPSSVCAGKSINLNASSPLPQSAGLAPSVSVGDRYTWASSGGSFVSTTGSPVSWRSSSSGTLSFTVTATNSNNCSATATASVRVNENPSVSISPGTSSLCTGQTLELRASPPNLQSAGLAPNVSIGDSYTWASSGGGNFVSSTNPATFSSSNTGGFSFTVTATNSNSCSTTATASVTVNAKPTASISPNSAQTLCVGTALNLIASGGSPTSWSGPNSFTANTATAGLNTSSTAYSGVYSVTVGSGICTATASLQVTIQQPTASINPTSVLICEGGTIALSGSSGSAYSWRGPNNFTSSQQNISISNATSSQLGTYSLTVRVGTCTATSTAEAKQGARIQAGLSGSNLICLGGTIQFTATSGFESYSWSRPGSTFTSTQQNPVIPSAKLTDAGAYFLNARSRGGCVGSVMVLVIVNAQGINAGFTVSPSKVVSGSPVTLSATSATGTYSWSGPSGSLGSSRTVTINPFTSSKNGTYRLTLTSGLCRGYTEQILSVPSSARLASGEEGEDMEMEVKAYPNPTSKLLTVEVKLVKPSSLNLQLFNATGNTLMEWNLSEESTLHRKEIDLSVYKDGLYLIQAQSKDGKQTKRVMKIE